MFSFNAEVFERFSAEVRYCLYVVTAFRLLRFRSWIAEGEPNPFVKKRRPTTRPISRIEANQQVADTLRGSNRK